MTDRYLVRVRNNRTGEEMILPSRAEETRDAMEEAVTDAFCRYGWRSSTALAAWKKVPLLPTTLDQEG